MPSFDIVSELDMQELRNAVDQASREVTTRYDFKGTDSSFELKESIITMHSDSDFQLKQMFDILQSKLIKRNIDLKFIEKGKVLESGKGARQELTVKQGIETEMAKKMVKMIKEKKMKVQAAIQGEKVRVTGKKRDDLQEVITMFKNADLDVPLQYENYRDQVIKLKLEITEKIFIDERDLEFQAVRSSGPGGQHVNKVSTKIILSCPFNRIKGISPEQYLRLKNIPKSFIVDDAVVRVSSQKHRSQYSNRLDAMERLIKIIKNALKEKKKRIETKLPYSAKQKRLQGKKKQSQRKSERRFDIKDDFQIRKR